MLIGWGANIFEWDAGDRIALIYAAIDSDSSGSSGLLYSSCYRNSSL